MATSTLSKLYLLADHWAVPKDTTSIGIFLLTVILVSIVFYSFSDRTRKRAPGPRGLPIVGYLPFMEKPIHVMFQKLARKYGSVMSIQLGSNDCIVLGSSEAVKEAFVKQNETFSGRPYYMNIRVNDHEKSFTFEEGETWKDLRTFSVQTLRELGFGQQTLEPVVQAEIEHFNDYLEEQSTKHSDGFYIGEMLGKSIGNTVCTFLLGDRCEYDDPWLNQIVKVVDDLQETYITDIQFFFPWMLKVPILKKFADNPKKRAFKDKLRSLWKPKIDAAKKAGNKMGPNYMASFLNEYKKRIDNNDPTAERFDDLSLLGNVDVLCQVAFETSSTTVQWAFLFMLEHPEMQTKLQQEIDDVVGQERLPAYSDAKAMPFTRAFISETHRKGSIVPLGVFHVNREATYLMGHWIPKRTVIISNLYAVHHDPKIFPDPERFDPSRFLDANGKFVKHESVMPFSVGKRFCPGEFVAEMQIFLYLTMLLQKYTIIAPSGYNARMSQKDTIANHPDPFKMLVKRR